jgi:anion-transporting  ArsA/GET3 family ATPase
VVCELGEGPPLEAPVDSLRLDPQLDLQEWLARHVGAAAAGLLRRAPVFSYFVAAAPGAAELVTLGKAVDEALSGRHERLIVDGPATGHALALLVAPRTFGALVGHGPVASEARELQARIADPAFAAYVGVTAPEELAVAELLELEAELQEVIGRGLDLVVINGVHADRFTDAEAERLRAAGLHAVLAEHELARRQARQVAEVRRHITAPVVTVPFVFPPAPATAARTAAPGAARAGGRPVAAAGRAGRSAARGRR